MMRENKRNPQSLFGGHRLTYHLFLNLSRQRRRLVISPWGVGCFRLHCDFCFSPQSGWDATQQVESDEHTQTFPFCCVPSNHFFN